MNKAMYQKVVPASASLPTAAGGSTTVTVLPFTDKGWSGFISMFFVVILPYLLFPIPGLVPFRYVLLLWLALGILFLLATGRLRLSSETIAYITPFARHQIRWDEVKSVVRDAEGMRLVFYAADRNKVLSVPGPLFWPRSRRQYLLKILEEEFAKRQIPVKQTTTWMATSSQNTRAK